MMSSKMVQRDKKCYQWNPNTKKNPKIVEITYLWTIPYLFNWSISTVNNDCVFRYVNKSPVETLSAASSQLYSKKISPVALLHLTNNSDTTLDISSTLSFTLQDHHFHVSQTFIFNWGWDEIQRWSFNTNLLDPFDIEICIELPLSIAFQLRRECEIKVKPLDPNCPTYWNDKTELHSL